MTQTIAQRWGSEASDLTAFGSADGSYHVRLPLPLRLILFTLFLPEAMSFYIGELRLTFTRLIFLILTPTVFLKLWQKIQAGRYCFVASDLFVGLTSLWMFIGPAATYDLADSVVHSGPVVLEYLIAYMSTRVLLSEQRQAVSFVGLLCLLISFVVFDALIDTATGTYFTREVVGQLTGYQKVWRVADELRFGLLRAAGPIEHPILFGFISSIGLLLTVAVKIRWQRFCVVSSALGVVICFSSAPEQSAIMGLGLLFYARNFRSFRHKWRLLSVPPVLVTIFLFTSTPTPFGHVFDLITIDPQTAYYRLYIWNAVGPAILENPYFAVQSNGYDYTGSVDSVWLVLALQYGMRCGVLTGLSLIGCCSLPTNNVDVRLSDNNSKLGQALGIVIFLIIFTGFTVHFWGATWILVGLLVGVRAHLGELLRWERSANHD